jgi:ABC-type lipoprotein release transport system permease subunit
VLFIKSSIEYQVSLSLQNQPDIVLQNQKGGRVVNSDENMMYDINSIVGIKSVVPRVYGWYKFDFMDKYFSIIGVDFFDETYNDSLKQIINNTDIKKFLDKDYMLIGNGVKESMNSGYYKEFFNFVTEESTETLYFYDTFKSSLDFETNDLIVMEVENAKKVLSMDEEECSDFAIYVHNPIEIFTITQKLIQKYPSYKIIVKDDLISSYKNLYDYKGGFFLSLFIVSLVTFVIILLFKASSLESSEKKEIAVLRAIGWSINDIIKYKMYENIIVSLFAFVNALIFATIYVYIFDAPILDKIFFGFSNITTSFSLIPIIDFQSIAIIFFATVPLYIGASIIPAYKSAIGDISEVLR